MVLALGECHPMPMPEVKPTVGRRRNRRESPITSKTLHGWAFWNGKRSILLKSALFGLTGNQEIMVRMSRDLIIYFRPPLPPQLMGGKRKKNMLYKYPQAEISLKPITTRENLRKEKLNPEYEWLNWIFDEDRYFDIFIEINAPRRINRGYCGRRYHTQ